MKKFTAISIALVSAVSASAAFADEPAAEAPSDAAPAAEAAPADAAPASSDEASSGDKASPQAEQKAISVAALLGNGFKDGYNIGLGVRGGYTLPMHVYIGGTLVYHLGKSVSGIKTHIMLVGAEGGYALDAGPVIVRPYLGLGLAHATVSGTIFGTSVSGSKDKFFIAPGVTGLYPLGSAFVGLDARYTLVSSANAFGLFLTGGLTF